MAERNLLHRSKLEEFIQYLVDNGFSPVKSNASFEVLRWKVRGKPMPIIFDGKSSEHFSCNESSVPYVMDFINMPKSSTKPGEISSLRSHVKALTAVSILLAADKDVLRYLKAEEPELIKDLITKLLK